MVNQCERELSAVAAYEVLPLRPKNRRYDFLKDQNSSARVGVDTLTLAWGGFLPKHLIEKEKAILLFWYNSILGASFIILNIWKLPDIINQTYNGSEGKNTSEHVFLGMWLSAW